METRALIDAHGEHLADRRLGARTSRVLHEAKPVPISANDFHKLVPISRDDPHHCDHCPCEPGPVACPKREPSLCALSGLWDAQRRSIAEHRGGILQPWIIGAWNCGEYVVVEEWCGTDCGMEYAYDASTGRIAASRSVDGLATFWRRCHDGYRTEASTQPPTFIFPKREGCSPLNAPELGLPNAATSPLPD